MADDFRPLRVLLLSLLALGILAVATLAYVFWPPSPDQLVASGVVPPVDQSLAQAREALQQNRWAEAERHARQAYVADRLRCEALLLASHAALGSQRPGDALAYLALVPDNSSHAAEAFATSGGLLLHMGRLSEAESHLRQALTLDPHHRTAQRRMGLLLSVTGRRWESLPYLFHMLRSKQFVRQELMMLSFSEQPIGEETLLNHSMSQVPDDPLSHLGVARLRFSESQFDESRRHIERVLALRPEIVEAWAVLGQLLLETNRFDELPAWEAGLPAGADEHPDIWSVRGQWAEHCGELREAVRCYAEAARLLPDHGRANHRLAQLLVALGETEVAEPFLERSQQLLDWRASLDVLYLEGPIEYHVARLARIAGEIGRPWESWAWHQALLEHRPGDTELQQKVRQLEQALESDPPHVLVHHAPIHGFDVGRFPLPELSPGSRIRTADEPPPSVAAVATNRPRFTDVAEAVGIDYVTYNGDDFDVIGGMEIFHQLAGGIVVFDYDGDGWPDVYVTQGTDWPPSSGQTLYRDRLFRNLGDGRFVDVTEQAGLGNAGYGQGATAGDFNNNGFPDLFVANIGANRLYRNNGDGTFADVSEQAGIQGELWSTSCVIADVTGNGLPDIYVVNYLAGPEVFETRCVDEQIIRSCRPQSFQAEQDRLYVNLGDGRFEDVTEESGLVVVGGKGLGIVAADFSGTGRLDLFVANDTTQNFLFVNQARSPGERPRFAERAALHGLAVDRDGKSQACMGVAVCDATGNGLVDMFITNFENEHFTLYEQQAPGLFSDRSREAGLRDPTLPRLGFGTQFLDANRNGWPDLVVANGHVNDYRDEGRPFEMPPQYFLNLGEGRFVELAAEDVGPYFEGAYVGRAMALLDWNRDGMQDVAISHLYGPLALLSNETPAPGHYLQVRLHAARSARDAFGASVVAHVGQRQLTRQLTAGSGYQASNQRQLFFGLGDAPRIDRLEVRWPSGYEQTFHDVPADQEVILIEGRDLVTVPPVDPVARPSATAP